MKVTASSNIVLIACGSFSPPTPMHLRMFEIARDHFHSLGTVQVLGGIISPTHDAYAKTDLIASTHRIAMLKLAVQTSDWIKVSEWECQQETWTRTRPSLQYHQNCMNSFIKESINGNLNRTMVKPWFPDTLTQSTTGNVQLKLLCGADLLESFSVPGLWKDEDIEAIVGQHGIVVVSRSGSNPEQFIFNSDLLSKYRHNITLVTNWVANEVSSTLVRRLFRRNLSVKYLLDDAVIDYVKRNGLYGSGDHTKYTDTGHNRVTINNLVNSQPSEPILSASDDDEDYEQANTNSEFVQTHIEITSPGSPVEQMDETDYTKIDLPSTTYKVFCCAGDTYNQRSPLITRPGGAVKVISSQDKIVDKDQRKVSLADDKAQKFARVNSIEVSDGGGIGNTPAPAQKQPSLHHKLKDKKNICNLSLSAPSTSTHVDKVNTGRVSPAKSYDEMIQFIFTDHGIKVISDKEYEV